MCGSHVKLWVFLPMLRVVGGWKSIFGGFHHCCGWPALRELVSVAVTTVADGRRIGKLVYVAIHNVDPWGVGYR